MRNLFSAVINWIAALFALGSGAPHPVVSTDLPGTDADEPRRAERRDR